MTLDVMSHAKMPQISSCNNNESYHYKEVITHSNFSFQKRKLSQFIAMREGRGRGRGGVGGRGGGDNVLAEKYR